MQAVNKKNKLAYFENCSAEIRKNDKELDVELSIINKMRKDEHTKEKFGNERDSIILASGNIIRTKPHIRRGVVQSNDPLSLQNLI